MLVLVTLAVGFGMFGIAAYICDKYGDRIYDVLEDTRIGRWIGLDLDK